MSKKQTLFEKRQAMKALRNGRIEAGLCSECGERERTRNLDGSKSVRCVACKERAERHMATHKGKRPPRLDGDGDLIDDNGHLDSDDFKSYEATCKGVIYASGLLDAISRPAFCFTVSPFFAPSFGDMRRILGDQFNDRRHADALSHLMAYGEIRERQSGALTRYEPAVRHDRSTIEFGRQYINGSKGVPKPDDAVFEDRRVTA